MRKRAGRVEFPFVEDNENSTVRAIWDAAKAGSTLIDRRDVTWRKGVGNGQLGKEFQKEFFDKSKIKKLKGLQSMEELTQEILDYLPKQSRHDKKMMWAVAKLLHVPSARSFFSTLGYFDELTEDHQTKVYKKLYEDLGFQPYLDVNRKGDVSKNEMFAAARQKARLHKDVMSGCPDFDGLYFPEKEIQIVKLCQDSGLCNDPRECLGCESCEIDIRSRREVIVADYLKEYMPNFFETIFTDEELSEDGYNPPWKHYNPHGRFLKRSENPASHRYNFHINWALSDEHLIDEFREWLVMRRPERFEGEGRLQKNKKLWLRVRDFRFWHIDYCDLTVASKVETYWLQHGGAKQRSGNDLRNSADKGLNFFEMAILSFPYLSPAGYVVEDWSF